MSNRRHRRTITVRPQNDTYVRVVRGGGSGGGGGGAGPDVSDIIIKVVCWVAGIRFGLSLLVEVLPWIIGGSWAYSSSTAGSAAESNCRIMHMPTGAHVFERGFLPAEV